MSAIANSSFVFDPEKHQYREDGILRPSVTQVLKCAGVINFDGVNPRVLERKAQLGTLVHMATELYDKGENLDDYEIPEDCWPYIEGWVNFRNDCDFQPELIEYQTIGDIRGMRYGMKLDVMGLLNGVPHILEKKCGASESPAWGVQTLAYAVGINRPNIARAAIQLGSQFSRNYKLHPYADPADLHAWMACLALTIWKLNHGLFVPEGTPERIEAL